MSEPLGETRSSSYVWVWGLAILSLVAAIAWLQTGIEHLLLGWLYFPLRVLPRMTVDWLSVLVGLTGLAGFVVGVHVTIRWYLRASSRPVRWSWRSSAAVSLLVLLMFAAGVAMVGATHLVVWLLAGSSRGASSTTEPVFGVIDAFVERSRKQEQSNHLREFAQGLLNFQDMFAGLPAGGTMSEEGELLHGWMIMLGPYNGISTDNIDFSVPWNRPPNKSAFQCNLPLFVNPAQAGPYFDDEGYGLSHVAGNIHVLPLRGVAADRRHGIQPGMRLEEITDGSSNTIAIGTAAQHFKPWGHPANLRVPERGIDRTPDGFGGPPQWRGAQFAMCDGSVRFMSNKTDPRVLRALGTPAGGEAVDSSQPQR